MSSEIQDPNGSDIIYIEARGALVAMTRWCALLQFTTPIGNPTDGISEHITAQVNIDWSMLKSIHITIGQAIEEYEKIEGTVSVPRSFLSPTGATKAE